MGTQDHYQFRREVSPSILKCLEALSVRLHVGPVSGTDTGIAWLHTPAVQSLTGWQGSGNSCFESLSRDALGVTRGARSWPSVDAVAGDQHERRHSAGYVDNGGHGPQKCIRLGVHRGVSSSS